MADRRSPLTIDDIHVSIDGSMDPQAIAMQDGNIIYSNAKFNEIVGKTAEEIMRASINVVSLGLYAYSKSCILYYVCMHAISRSIYTYIYM